MKLCIIVNPNAGRKQGLAAADKAADLFKSRDVDFDIKVSEKPGDSVTLAENLDTETYTGIIAVGGDGTLFEVINGLLKSRKTISIPVGQIPVGTGNSFIKDLGISSIDQALSVIIGGNTKNIDLGKFSSSSGSFYFANLLGTGFVSNVAYRAQKYKKLGAFSYILGVLEEVTVLKSVEVLLNIDGKEFKKDVIFTEICNSRYTGGDMLMAPDAEIDDGLLDVVILNKVSRVKLLSLFPKLFKGTHINDPAIEVLKGKIISLKSSVPMALTPDGETFGETPVEITTYPKKIKMFC